MFHKMITWQDLRASEDVESWNNSFTLSALNKGAKFAHFFTRRKRHLAASVLKFMSQQVNGLNMMNKSCFRFHFVSFLFLGLYVSLFVYLFSLLFVSLTVNNIQHLAFRKSKQVKKTLYSFLIHPLSFTNIWVVESALV